MSQSSAQTPDGTALPSLPAPEANPGLLVRVLALLGLAVGALLLILIGMVPLPWPQQAVLGLAAVLCALWLRYDATSPTITLTLSLLAGFTAFRYAVWRITAAVHFFRSPGVTLPWGSLVALLLVAEAYAVVFLLLRLVQAAAPLRRAPAALPADPRRWPAVDVVVLAHREPLAAIRSTVLAALYLDWPAAKLHVALLDDGRRDDLRVFAEEAGVAYRSRAAAPSGWGANLNSALADLHAPFLAVFHAGDVPARSFLQLTVGWFLRDRRLALLQTADASALLPGQAPAAAEQAARDTWNMVAFTGSAAVLRHVALQEIGGIPTQTTAPGLHTSLRMGARGWNTGFLDLPQTAPQPLTSLAHAIQRRARWNRGIGRMMALERPLLTGGLTAEQRVATLFAQVQTLSALPRLLFLTVPPLCLLLGVPAIPGFWPAVLAYALPYLALAGIAAHHRAGTRPFWARLHETMLAPNLLAAGAGRGEPASLTRPLAALLALNVLGLLAAVPRVFRVPVPGLESLYHQAPLNALILGLLWSCFNLVVLGAAMALATIPAPEAALSAAMLVDVVLPGGAALVSVAAHLSASGAAVALARPLRLDALLGASVQLVVPTPAGTATLPATLLTVESGTLRLGFPELTLSQHEDLTLALYARADRWLPREDSPAPGLGSLARGVRRAFPGGPGRGAPRRFAPSILPLVLFLLVARSPCTGQTRNPFPGYAVSALSVQAHLTSLVTRYPWAATLAVTVVCLLMAALLEVLLRSHMARRLAGDGWLTSSTMPLRDTEDV